jgi:hypothetical protein
MKKQDIYNIALTYREAILRAKYNREFDRRDRMSNFPCGCCDDSCDLFAHYFIPYTVFIQSREMAYIVITILITLQITHGW